MVEFGTPRIILPADAKVTSEAVAVDINTNHQRRGEFIIALWSLLEVNADAIAYRALPHFGPSLSGGIFRALKVNAGVSVFYEAQAKADQLRQIAGIDINGGKQLPPGFALSTTTGNLPERYRNIIHVNLQIEDNSSAKEHIYAVSNSAVNCLREAEKLGLSSIAFPALGAYSGVLLEESLGGTLAGTKTFYSEKPDAKLNRVLFVAHGDPSLANAQECKDILEHQLSRFHLDLE